MEHDHSGHEHHWQEDEKESREPWKLDPKFITIMLALGANLVAISWGASNVTTRLSSVEDDQNDMARAIKVEETKVATRFTNIEVMQSNLNIQQAHFDEQIRALGMTIARLERVVDRVRLPPNGR